MSYKLIDNHMQSFSDHGVWWIPDQEDRQIAGMIEYSPSEGITLELNDSLSDHGGRSLAHGDITQKVPIIHGLLSDGRFTTVVDSTRTSCNYNSGNKIPETYRSPRMFLNGKIKDAQFQKVDVITDEIDDWIGQAVIQPMIVNETSDIDLPNQQEVRGAFATAEPDVFIAELENFNVRVSSRVSGELSTDFVQYETTGGYVVKFQSPREYDEIRHVIDDILRYISVAIGKPVYPDKINLHLDDKIDTIQVFEVMDIRKQDINVTQFDYLFRPGTVDFETTMNSWFTIKEQSNSFYNRLVDLIYEPDNPPDIEILQIVITLEAYYDDMYSSSTYISEDEYEEFKSSVLDLVPENEDLQSQIHGLLTHVGNEPSIKHKLLTLCENHESVLSSLFDIDEMTSEARKLRNDIAHGQKPDDGQISKELIINLYATLFTIVLTELGLDEDEIQKSISKRYYR